MAPAGLFGIGFIAVVVILHVVYATVAVRYANGPLHGCSQEVMKVALATACS